MPPKSAAREIGIVSLTELVILGFFLLPLWLGYPALITAMLWLMLLGIYIENIKLVGRISALIKITTGLGCAIMFFLLCEKHIPMLAQMIMAGFVIVMLIANIYLSFNTKVQKWLLAYPLVLIPFIAFLSFDQGHSKLIVFTYLVVESFDSFAYLGGKLFGRHKAFPKLSPKKTIEGLVIGAVCSVITGFLAAPYLAGYRFPQLLPLMAVMITGTLFGDLAASKIKRQLGIKDLGHILPLQGGVLDIYDSIIFTAPMVFIYLKLAA